MQTSSWFVAAYSISRMEMGDYFHGFHYKMLRTSRQHDSIMVVVDRFGMVAHFIVVKSTNSTSEVAQVFIK